ncbi:MAG: sulfatase-like hydrolase/transferase [Deltaproteobacteria bacterium]|nr:sulfatase-like hydrolase/transferase [Deltaproteobacteria bacterium]
MSKYLLKIQLIGLCLTIVLFGLQTYFFVAHPDNAYLLFKVEQVPNFAKIFIVQEMIILFFVFLFIVVLIAFLLFIFTRRRPLQTMPILLVLLTSLLYLLGRGWWDYPASIEQVPWLKSISLQTIFLGGVGVLLLLTGLTLLLTKSKLKTLPYLFLFILSQIAIGELVYYENFRFQLPPHTTAAGKFPDVYLLGFDAVDHATVQDILVKQLPSNHSTVFNHAITPVPSTNPAWHSLLSGLLPFEHGVRFFYGQPTSKVVYTDYLPHILKNFGFTTYYAADEPKTSYFEKDSGFNQILTQTYGWKFWFRTHLWNSYLWPSLVINNSFADRLLPQHNFNYADLYRYNPERFINKVFRWSGQTKSPNFLAFHTCYLHSPIHLNRWDLASHDTHYLKLSPSQFNFSNAIWYGHKELQSAPVGWINPYQVRKKPFRQFFDQFLVEFKAQGYFKNSITFLFSDHGERFHPNGEYFGGIHGMDLDTQEQMNVMLALVYDLAPLPNKIDYPVSLLEIKRTLLPLLLPTQDSPSLLNPERKPLYMESLGMADVLATDPKQKTYPIGELLPNLILLPSGAVDISTSYERKVVQSKVIKND